jgi:hypothetical protein
MNENLVAAVPSEAEIQDILARAQVGDASAMPTVLKWFENPKIVDLMGGDLARLAQTRLIDRFSGTNLVCREALPRKLDQLRAEVGGPHPSPLERLLVDRVVAGWVHLHYLEVLYFQAASLTPTVSTYYQRSIQRAQANYLAAIKTLATVRKLALPVLQVNVARKQVNVLNAPGGGEAVSVPVAG